jgi:hypothetical protein
LTVSRARAKAPGDLIRLKPAQQAAAEQAWRAVAAVLETGAQGADLVLRAELLRAVHSCRAASLPRLSSAGLRAGQQLRNLHDRRPEFRLASLSWDVYQVLRTAHVLRSGEPVAARWIGEARRGYARVGSLRLAGLFTEPVVSGSGYAGVVTYLADESGQLWSLGDVAPGDAHRCQFAYVTSLELGELTLEHRALGRSGLVLEGATAAANRRLGMGRGVVATDAPGVGFDAVPLVSLWETPLGEQLDRAWAARGEDERHAGDDMLFMRCGVLGATREALALQTDTGVLLHAVAPSGHAELAYRRNLQLLARAAGMAVWVLGRIVYARPRTLALLAVASPMLRVPSDWGGRVNLGLDRLRPEHLPAGAIGGAASLANAEPAAVDPLDPLERRLQQVLLGGRSAASAAAASGFARDEAALARSQLATGAELLARLRQSQPEHLAEAWLAARLYVAAASARLQREAWPG